MSQIALYLFAVLMMMAAYFDATRFTIPNWLCGLVALTFVVAAPFSGLGWSELGLHALTGFAALLLGMLLFATGTLGGGDAKLIAAAALWFGWPDTGWFIGFTALTGGGLALLLLTLRRTVPMLPVAGGWIEGSALEDGAPVPYGIALAAGALIVLPGHAFFTGV